MSSLSQSSSSDRRLRSGIESPSASSVIEIPQRQGTSLRRHSEEDSGVFSSLGSHEIQKEPVLCTPLSHNSFKVSKNSLSSRSTLQVDHSTFPVRSLTLGCNASSNVPALPIHLLHSETARLPLSKDTVAINTLSSGPAVPDAPSWVVKQLSFHVPALATSTLSEQSDTARVLFPVTASTTPRFALPHSTVRYVAETSPGKEDWKFYVQLRVPESNIPELLPLCTLEWSLIQRLRRLCGAPADYSSVLLSSKRVTKQRLRAIHAQRRGRLFAQEASVVLSSYQEATKKTDHNYSSSIQRPLSQVYLPGLASTATLFPSWPHEQSSSVSPQKLKRFTPKRSIQPRRPFWDSRLWTWLTGRPSPGPVSAPSASSSSTSSSSTSVLSSSLSDFTLEESDSTSSNGVLDNGDNAASASCRYLSLDNSKEERESSRFSGNCCDTSDAQLDSNVTLSDCSDSVPCDPEIGLERDCSVPLSSAPEGVKTMSSRAQFAKVPSFALSNSTFIRKATTFLSSADALRQRHPLYAALDSRLKMLQCEITSCAADGNWQFRAASTSLYGTEEYHAWVRHTVVAYMSNLKRRYQRFFPNSEVFAQYLLEMSRNATWGDHLTLCAIADAFRCAFHLITSNEKTWYFEHTPRSADDAPEYPSRHLFFCYLPPVYYNAIVSTVPPFPLANTP